MLHHTEWLALAKNVPLGQKRRVTHGAEPSPAMDVYNNVDSWSCYCHRCHQGGKVSKGYVAQSVPEPQRLKYCNSKDLIELHKLSVEQPLVYKELVYLLHRKGMSTVLLEPYRPMYNTKDQRLVLRFKGVTVGRDLELTNAVRPKWYKYAVDNPVKFLYLQGKSKQSKYIVLHEDLFSCIKTTHYTGLSTMWLMGTNFENEKLNFIMENKLYPIITLDGDSAGQIGTRNINNSLALFDIDCTTVDVPLGLDPKDLKPSQLLELYKDFL